MRAPFIVLVGTLTGLLQDFRAQAQKERREVEALFGSYVSPELVSEVLNEKITFKGEEKSATVMFTDLIGFTKLAERLAPAQLLELLNVYFAEKVEIVLMHRGYINKFIGDSIMAVFGAPLDQAEHPMQAVRTAIQMHLKLDKINAQPLFKDNQLGMGIGINTGLVIAGNVGSARRMEYTVLGDTVNLASRIEALTRKYGTGILIGESTHNQIREDDFFMMREIDSVRVKGRQRSVVLYEVYNHCTSDERQKKEATLEDFQSAIASYRDCDWDRSETLFQRVLERYPEDTVSKLYLARLDTLRITPPPEDWKGVFEFLDK